MHFTKFTVTSDNPTANLSRIRIDCVDENFDKLPDIAEKRVSSLDSYSSRSVIASSKGQITSGEKSDFHFDQPISEAVTPDALD